jgi:hypothetical protein
VVVGVPRDPRKLVVALLFAAVLAVAQPLVFTIRTHPTCPVETSAFTESKDFAFQFATFHNESPKFVESLSLKVAFAAGSQEEIVDHIRIRVHLAPGDSGRFAIQLGPIPPLEQKLRSSGQKFARVVLFVDSAEFSDGTEWSSEEPVIDVPVGPERVR